MNKHIPYQNDQSGAFHKDDPRDYSWPVLAAAAGIDTEFDWDKGFDTEKRFDIKIKHESQNGSLSCTGMALSTYGEFLEFIETGIVKQFSSKRIYQDIALLNGGAYIRDALNHAIKKGFVLETDVSSYLPDGKAPTEAFMKEKFILSRKAEERAITLRSKEYFAVPVNINQAAQALEANFMLYMAATGSNKGWSSPNIRPPLRGEETWGHAFIGKAAVMRNNKKVIKGHNSWGEKWGDKGDFFIDEKYFKSGNIYTSYVLVDRLNFMKLKLLNAKNCSTVYLIDMLGQRRAFYDVAHFMSVAPLLGLSKKGDIPDWSQVQEVEESELIKYPLGRPIVLIA